MRLFNSWADFLGYLCLLIPCLAIYGVFYAAGFHPLVAIATSLVLTFIGGLIVVVIAAAVHAALGRD